MDRGTGPRGGGAKVEVVREADAIALVGELDVSNVSAVADVLGQAADEAVVSGDDLVLDCSRLGFIDSTGLHVLVGVAQRMEGRSRLVLRSPQSGLRRLLELTDLARMANLEVNE